MGKVKETNTGRCSTEGLANMGSRYHSISGGGQEASVEAGESYDYHSSWWEFTSLSRGAESLSTTMCEGAQKILILISVFTNPKNWLGATDLRDPGTGSLVEQDGKTWRVDLTSPTAISLHI